VTDPWLDELAGALGGDGLDSKERSMLLDVARDVAHGVERRITPLSAFLLGEAVERRRAAGASREDALRTSIESLRSMLPGAEVGEAP
jgi:hypothetical protein